MLGPPFPMMPKKVSLFGSGLASDSPLEGHSLRNLSLSMPGVARNDLPHCILFELSCVHFRACEEGHGRHGLSGEL